MGKLVVNTGWCCVKLYVLILYTLCIHSMVSHLLKPKALSFEWTPRVVEINKAPILLSRCFQTAKDRDAVGRFQLEQTVAGALRAQ
jgi:hypothetical protein